MTLLHLHPLWNATGEWHALFALCPREQQAWLAERLQASPSLHDLPCYLPGAAADLPPLQPVVLRGQYWQGSDALICAGFEAPGFLATLPAGSLTYGPGYLLPAQARAGHPSQPALMQILALVVADAETHELEEAFALAPTLTHSLLKLVNSVGIGSRVDITSIRHAITVLGRRQLQRWLQLLLYAEQFGNDGENAALMTGAALRAKRLENWAQQGWLSQPADSAFLVGMLSLLDRLFGQPLAELLGELPLPPALRQALLAQEGELGRALHCVITLESGKATELPSPRITPRSWLESEISAFDWARQIQAYRGNDRAE